MGEGWVAKIRFQGFNFWLYWCCFASFVYCRNHRFLGHLFWPIPGVSKLYEKKSGIPWTTTKLIDLGSDFLTFPNFPWIAWPVPWLHHRRNWSRSVSFAKEAEKMRGRSEDPVLKYEYPGISWEYIHIHTLYTILYNIYIYYIYIVIYKYTYTIYYIIQYFIYIYTYVYIHYTLYTILYNFYSIYIL